MFMKSSFLNMCSSMFFLKRLSTLSEMFLILSIDVLSGSFLNTSATSMSEFSLWLFFTVDPKT